MRHLHHSHDHGHAVDIGPDLKGKGNYKVRIFSEAVGPSFGDHQDVNSTLEAFQRAFHFAIKEHAKDGKMREVSVIIGEPRPENTICEEHIICGNCKASGAHIQVGAWDMYAECLSCGAQLPISEEQANRHLNQVAKSRLKIPEKPH
jgi:hypothetical protein